MTLSRCLAAAASVAATLIGSAAAQDIQFAPGAAPYVQAASGMIFPVQVGDFLRGRGYRYAADGSDESVDYHLGRSGSEITVTVNVSPSPTLNIGADADPLALSAARAMMCAAEFDTVQQEIEAAYYDETPLGEAEADMAYARGMSTGFAAAYALNAPNFWGRRNVPVTSEAILFCYLAGRWSVKYRFTYPSEIDPGADIAAFMRGLRWTIGGDPGWFTGTGFLVSGDGLIVTSHHLVAGARSLEVVANGASMPAVIVSADPTNDIAVLRATVEGNPLAVAPASPVRRGDEVLTVGYPRIDIQAQSPQAAFGRVNALAGAADDARYLQVDLPVELGNSGGPLLNRRGQVVGVVTASAEQSLTLRPAGAPRPTLNHVLKAEYLSPLLPTEPIPAASRPAGLREAADVARDVESSIFLVIARR